MNVTCKIDRALNERVPPAMYLTKAAHIADSSQPSWPLFQINIENFDPISTLEDSILNRA